jgi:hypothetical protein
MEGSMQARQKQVIEAYQRVQDFLAAHPVPPPGSYGPPKQLLDEVVARLTDHSSDQVAGGRLSRADTQRQKKLRTALRELHLRPISKIARAALSDMPAIDRALRMPAPQLSTTALIAEAAAMRDAVSKYADVLIKNGRPEDFLAKLDAASEELRQSILGRARNVGKKVGAKAGLKQEIQRGRAAVEMLDAIVTTTFANDSNLLAKWRIARRVQSVPGSGVSATGGTAEENLAPAPAAA